MNIKEFEKRLDEAMENHGDGSDCMGFEQIVSVTMDTLNLDKEAATKKIKEAIINGDLPVIGLPSVSVH